MSNIEDILNGYGFKPDSIVSEKEMLMILLSPESRILQKDLLHKVDEVAFFSARNESEREITEKQISQRFESCK